MEFRRRKKMDGMEFYGRRRPGEEEGKTVTDGYNESTYAACSKHMSR